MNTEKSLYVLLDAVRALRDLPVMRLAENRTLVQEISSVINGRNIAGILEGIRRDYQIERSDALNKKRPSSKWDGLTPESDAFLHSFARFKSEEHRLTASAYAANVNYTEIPGLDKVSAFNSAGTAETIQKIIPELEKTKPAQEFKEAFNSIFSDHALQIGTLQDPTRISSYIDYSPYIWNYQFYLSIPTLAQTIDRSIQIATREAPRIECKDPALSELLTLILKRSRFVEKLRRLLLFSHLSPRGSLIVPIRDNDGTVRFNIFNDTQFSYSSGYQYTKLDYRDDGSDGVREIFALGHLLRNGVTAHFLCPGFEPIFAIGKNRLFQLKDAAEAVNIYLYTVKVLCIRAQIIVSKWGGEGGNDTLLEKMRRMSEDIDSKLSLSTSQKIPEGAELDILTNNLSEGFAKVSPIIKEYQGMLSGVMPDYFYGSDTAYAANNFNIHATHQTIRAEVQEGQIEPVYRFIVNKYLQVDKRFEKWRKMEDDFDIVFESLYEPTDVEKADIDSKKIDNIIKMADYPELKNIFQDEGLLGRDYTFPKPDDTNDANKNGLPDEEVKPA